jgi:hypothetical protein
VVDHATVKDRSSLADCDLFFHHGTSSDCGQGGTQQAPVDEDVPLIVSCHSFFDRLGIERMNRAIGRNDSRADGRAILVPGFPTCSD